MTGPEHYIEAEQLVSAAKDADPDADPADVAILLQFAQVHATLALAAATALQAPAGEGAGMYVADVAEWERAASLEERERGDRS